MVLLIGMILLVTAAFLIQGQRNAWILALILSILSLFGHLFKALDYEEIYARSFCHFRPGGKHETISLKAIVNYCS